MNRLIMTIAASSLALLAPRAESQTPRDSVVATVNEFFRAMTAHPEIVGGRAERLDTKVMLAGRGQIVSKVGAEGVYTAGVRPSDAWPLGLGIAIKIEDGEDRRSRPTVVIETLRQLGVLNASELEELAPYSSFTIRNHRGDHVGEVRPSFELAGREGSRR